MAPCYAPKSNSIVTRMTLNLIIQSKSLPIEERIVIYFPNDARNLGRMHIDHILLFPNKGAQCLKIIFSVSFDFLTLK